MEFRNDVNCVLRRAVFIFFKCEVVLVVKFTNGTCKGKRAMAVI